jgi:chromatin remodeling complex protein RSC6
MPAKKTVKTETETVSVSAPVTENVVAAAPTTKKTKKVAAPVEVVSETPAVAVTVSTTPATEAVVVTESDNALAEQSAEFMSKLQQLGAIINSLKAEYKTLEKKWTRDLKIAQKLSSKRKRKAGNRAPSGFVKPTKISDELAKFLEKPTGSEMARTDVTREINTYIRAHKLQDKDNGRKINPDTKLATLLKLKKNDELTYFNLQKYMSPHFAKNVKVETATA